MAHVPFLSEEFASMAEKGQCVVLPHLTDKELLELRLIPPGVKEDMDRRSRWLGDYSVSNLNAETLSIAAMSAIKYGRALDCLIR